MSAKNTLKFGLQTENNEQVLTFNPQQKILERKEETVEINSVQRTITFLVKVITPIIPLLPFKFWLVFGLSFSTVGVYFVYQLFSWKTLYTIIGLTALYLGFSFYISLKKNETANIMAKSKQQTWLTAEMDANSTQLRIAEINSTQQQKALDVTLQKEKLQVECEIHKIDKDSELEKERIKKMR